MKSIHSPSEKTFCSKKGIGYFLLKEAETARIQIRPSVIIPDTFLRDHASGISNDIVKSTNLFEELLTLKVHSVVRIKN